MSKREVFIIGSKGIPAKYGGFESFVENLTFHRKSNHLYFHVACMASSPDKKMDFEYHSAHCFGIRVPEIGAAKAVLYDLKAFDYVLRYIEQNKVQKPIVYVLACRIGFAIGYYKRQLEKLGGTLLLNPDGHEWKRAKWNWMIKQYWKYSERMMVKYADEIVCDSKNIESYIQKQYWKLSPLTTYIAYGADISKSGLNDDDLKIRAWNRRNQVKPGEYYLVVGRFIPENNYETIIREYMKTSTTKKLVFITNADKSSFYRQLKFRTDFEKDKRIIFAGTVYDQELLKKIRENAFAYIHGHEVGGTNPSLLEALGSTKLNLLLDVGFNREVGEKSAVYWTKDKNSLSGLIMRVDHMPETERAKMGDLAKNQIRKYYNWDMIVEKYECIFLREI